MLNDWFRELEFQMPWEAFLSLPRHPAYRYQYRNGRAKISGNPRFYHVRRDLGEQSRSDAFNTASAVRARPFSFRPLIETDWDQLPTVYLDAFARTPPFGALPESEHRAAAEALLTRTRLGQDGPLVPAACWVAEASPSELLGASLVTLVPRGDLSDFSSNAWLEPPPPDALETGWGQPHLTWIFVTPAAGRRGVATRLLEASEKALLPLGYRSLVSTFLLGNHASMLWHWKNRFELVRRPGLG